MEWSDLRREIDLFVMKHFVSPKKIILTNDSKRSLLKSRGLDPGSELKEIMTIPVEIRNGVRTGFKLE